MKLIIDISEETINEIKDNAMFAGSLSSDIRWDVTSAIVNGTPLDDVKAEIDQYLFQNEFGLEYRKEVLQILDNIGKAESEDT